MAMKYLGETFDIHGGGLENQFPHHECEIAQSECATGHPFAKYWMHNNMVTTGGVKMGKSLGNSAYLRDLYKQYDPLSLRFTILQSHYRGTTEFAPEAITAADTGYQKLLGSYRRLVRSNKVTETTPLWIETQTIVKEFIEAMNDDFNTAKAIAVLYELSTETNNAIASVAKEQFTFGFRSGARLPEMFWESFQPIRLQYFRINPMQWITRCARGQPAQNRPRPLRFATSDSIRKRIGRSRDYPRRHERWHHVAAEMIHLDLSRFFDHHPVLETERLRLRQLTMSDALDLHEYYWRSRNGDLRSIYCFYFHYQKRKSARARHHVIRAKGIYYVRGRTKK